MDASDAVRKLQDYIERARKAQRENRQKHDVQLELTAREEAEEQGLGHYNETEK